MSKVNPRQLLAPLGFACLLLLPSFDMPLKYYGIAGMAAYFLLGLAGILICYYLIIPNLEQKLSERVALALLLLTFAGLVVIVAIGYPLANSGRFGGGSDMDEALIIGATEIVNGRYPYYQRTYLGGLLSPMPGAIILSIPFVLLHLLSYQNIFWLGALAAVVRKFLGRYSYALLVLWTVLAVSPTAYQVLVTGSDHITNTLYILVSMWLVIKAADSTSGRFAGLLPALLLGVGLSSRSNFLLLMPLFLSVLVQTAGWKAAIRYCAVAGVAFIAVTLPFWLYDPSGFAPSTVQASKLEALSATLPGAPVIIPFSAFLLSFTLALTRMKSDCAAFFRNCAIVQLFALYFPSLVYAAGQGELMLFLGTAGYGMFTILFAAVSAWIYLSKPGSESRL